MSTFAHFGVFLYLCTRKTAQTLQKWGRRAQKRTIMNERTKKILKVIISVLIAALTALATGLGLTSCNVTRTVTTQSQYYQKGDTTCTIVTKTIETYDATKKL